MQRQSARLFSVVLALVLVGVAVADIAEFPYNDGPGLCALMDNNYPARTASPFSEGYDSQTCVVGSAKTGAKSDVLRVVNLFRYFVGMDPAPNYDSTQDKKTQECAMMNLANGGLNHNWPNTARCWTADGNAGCGSSNLAMGRSNPSDIMSQYIQDSNVASLGHRRWIFSPTLDRISFGGTGIYSSLYVFGTKANTNTRRYWAWPPEGYVPLQMITKTGNPQLWNYATPDPISNLANCQIMFGNTNVMTGPCTAETSNYGVYKSVMLPVGASAAVSGCYTVSFSYSTGSQTKTVSYTVTLYDCTKIGTGGGLTNCPANSAVRALPAFNPGNPVVIGNAPTSTTSPIPTPTATPRPAPTASTAPRAASAPRLGPAPVPSPTPSPTPSPIPSPNPTPSGNSPVVLGAPSTSAIGSSASSVIASFVLVAICGFWAVFA